MITPEERDLLHSLIAAADVSDALALRRSSVRASRAQRCQVPRSTTGGTGATRAATPASNHLCHKDTMTTPDHWKKYEPVNVTELEGGYILVNVIVNLGPSQNYPQNRIALISAGDRPLVALSLCYEQAGDLITRLTQIRADMLESGAYAPDTKVQ